MTDRRRFLTSLAAAALPLRVLAEETRTYAPPPVPADTGARGRVLVVGGGMGGATAAKYFRLWGGAGVQVTLIERQPRYVSNIMSNLVLNGSRTVAQLTYSYDALTRNYGVVSRTGDVVAIDPVARKVTLAGGPVLQYDRLVLAPGVSFDTVPGLETAAAQAAIPHAWVAGAQTTALRSQLVAMPDGGTFVLTIPPKPYRCPPGPYERACVVADYLKRSKPKAKVIVLDANPSIVAEPETFHAAFTGLYGGMLTYVPNANVLSVDATTRTVRTTLGDFRGHVVNVIPPQRAGALVLNAGLANANGGRFAGVDLLTYESTAAPNVHVIGDSHSSAQPKAGHIAAQEARVLVDAVTRILRGDRPDPAPMTNSSCFSPITASTASWLTAVFAYDPVTRGMVVVPGASAESARVTTDNFQEMQAWFGNLMADTFM